MHVKIMWTLQYITTYFDVSYLFGQTLCLIQLITCINKICCFFSGNIKVVHPVHLHGHHFHVIKIAYPPFNPETGNSTAFNPDIRCLNEPCTRATWADPSWINGNIPGVNLVNPPLKDSVNVPANGYVIIRFMADNPGIQIYRIFLVNSRLFFLIGICSLEWHTFWNLMFIKIIKILYYYYFGYHENYEVKMLCLNIEFQDTGSCTVIYNIISLKEWT